MPVTFVTCDCFFNQIQREDDALGRLDWSRINGEQGLLLSGNPGPAMF